MVFPLKSMSLPSSITMASVAQPWRGSFGKLHLGATSGAASFTGQGAPWPGENKPTLGNQIGNGKTHVCRLFFHE